MKKISLKEIAFPIDVDIIIKILQGNGVVKVAELPDMDGFYLLDEEGVLIPWRQILVMVWEQYLRTKIADYLKIIKADDAYIDIKGQQLILYFLPEDRKRIEQLRKRDMNKLQEMDSLEASYIS